MNEPNYYDWVPFFRELCGGIADLSDKPDRDYLLYLKAQETFQEGNAILKYPYIDPFSFIYALAQKKTTHQLDAYYGRAKRAFNIKSNIPSDLVFPTPIPQSKSLFYAQGKYIDNFGSEVNPDALWNLFDSVFNNYVVDEADFAKVLSIKNVGVIKLSQTMFLVNPEHFIPFDTQMNCLPLPELEDLKSVVHKVELEGYSAYVAVVKLLKDTFQGCKLYEINLLNALVNSPYGDQLRVSNKYCQISTNVYGQAERDYFNDFIEDNAVWTGGPAGETGTQIYPLTDFKRGDIVLVRRGTKRLGGIGVILNNQYIPGGFDEDAVIKIVWLVKHERKITETALWQRIGFDQAADVTLQRFKELYPQTFQILQYIRLKQRTMINHSLNKHKNIILAGPPGTGKTRKALQIAEWLTKSLDHSITLMEAIDKDIFQGEPNVEDISEVELIQFHPSYTYEDFVRGISTHAEGDRIIYKVENKCLAKIAAEAALPENSSKAFVLIIDEINRANLSAVLGELIYALEYRGKAVHTLYAYDGSTELTLPDNLYIIGTMNTADRSVGHIDYAIRRRFAFVPVLPDSNAIKNSGAKLLYQKVYNLFEKYTSADFDKDNVRIGHSYFLGGDADLWVRLKYEIKPILLEYVRDGVLLDAAKQTILDL